MKAPFARETWRQIRFPQSIQNIVAALIALGCVAVIPFSAFGQGWTCGSGSCTTTGNVGIGTSTPSSPLAVTGTTLLNGGINFTVVASTDHSAQLIDWGPTFGTPAMYMYNAGASTRWGWGLNAGEMQFFSQNGTNNHFSWNVGGDLQFASTNSLMVLNQGTSGGTPELGIGTVAPTTTLFVQGSTGINPFAIASPTGTQLFTVTQAGSVGIGTTSPQYPLSVNGTIQAKEVLVSSGWSDYVFEPDYRLAPLSEVADYIAVNHHLPEIPSGTEVEEKGVSLGEMQTKLLAKIEELTLHMIQAERRSDQMERENRELVNDNLEIRNEIAHLKEHGAESKTIAGTPAR